MKIFDKDLWDEVMATLSKNMLRTFLTTLGVIFAVLILILLLGATTGLSNGFAKIFAGTATNSMFLWSQQTSMPYKGFDKGRRIEFTLDDAELLTKQVPEIELISPRTQLGNFRGTVTVTREGRTSGSSVYGDYPSIDRVSKKRMVEGRFINQSDLDEARKVCVIGLDTYQLLFDKGEKAVGEFIQVNGIYFMVVGVYKRNDNINFEGENSVFLPFSTFSRAFNTGDKIGWMAIMVKSNASVATAERKIKTILKRKYSVHPDDPRAIGSFDFSQIFQGISAFTFVLQGFSFFIGLFSLIAGVIAVSNILLITVKERTKEIGVRRALGATPRIIKTQILMESIVLTVFAGLVGFVISTGLLYVLNVQFGDGEDFPFKNPTVSIVQVTVLFALMVGLSLLIGLIPANRAIKIKPIEALREE
ncbi:ABC transporter permease [Robertkochia sediminum]|uniref:ABC transporter permease n=1 Tax=Robertkochia sediminum TaxID=2785326 RepID=UPI0019343272|nr:ABC transporter permease [Robertkochia sediminum]MBL7472000.1 ABC transporter permease [Robertkochia sediminum]